MKMGNHHGHHHDHHGKSSGVSTPSSNGSRKSITRTASGGDIQPAVPERPSQLVPVEKLTKILNEKAQKEDNINGVTLNVFIKYLFPRYPILATKLYDYFLVASKTKHSYMSTSHFKQQCEKYLSLLDDELIRNILIRMFATTTSTTTTSNATSTTSQSSSSSMNNDNNNDFVIVPDQLTELLMCTYHISMDHYSEGPQMCLSISKTLKSIVDSCFHGKTNLSSHFVVNWMAMNCPRLLVPLHRYTVHTLTTAWRTLEHDGPTLAAGLELATPVLEMPPQFVQGKPNHPHLLHMSMSWLLAGALPPVYSRPQKANSPNNSGVGLSTNFLILSKFICPLPSHWVVLYDSDEMGLGANRFLHHVLAYKGPTLIFLLGENEQLFCIASPNEWKESHLYWGGEDAAVIQLLPKFLVKEKGSKMLYLNLTVRGYPHGLRAGSDPRNPIITIDAGFEKMEFRKIPYNLLRIEVWGCGDPVKREIQLEIKKWEVSEAERQRCVKLSAADWLDHPDRYLLELGGRTQYHQNQNQPQ